MTEPKAVETLTYEESREELKRIVHALETGSAPLEETLRMWKRGEELAGHCQRILASAQAEVDAALKQETGPAETA